MIEWTEYIDHLLKDQNAFDGIDLSFGDGQKSVGIPPIIKSSILMLDLMETHQGKNNILVFPEKAQSIFIFTLVKLLHNISERKIERAYDPATFQVGDRLRFGKAVVEFIGMEKQNERIKLKTADLSCYSAPQQFFPLFQKTSAKKLSKYSVFSEARKEAKKNFTSLAPSAKHLVTLSDYRTHMSSSIFDMTAIINTKKAIKNCRLCGQKISDVLLLGQADYTGAVKNLGTGQLAGIPAIVLAPDLYSISAAANSGHPVQSIIIDASNSNAILTQMDALDELMRIDVPITCVTDIANSFDLQPFITRGFNIWRWDELSISSNLYDATPLTSDRKIKYCATRKVQYLQVDGHAVSEAIKKLYRHRAEIESLSPEMMKLFDDLYSLSFIALRETASLAAGDLERAHSVLSEGLFKLETEKPFLSPAIYNDLEEVICSLDAVFSPGYKLMKREALNDLIKNNSYVSVCIVVPERSEKKHVENYWRAWCQENALQTEIIVVYPTEYYPLNNSNFCATVIVGWLKRAIMQKILYSFNSQNYIVLLYDCEQSWKNHDTVRWNSVLDSSSNKAIISHSFNNDRITISTTRFRDVSSEPQNEATGNDELNEIEQTLRNNKVRQYVSKGSIKGTSETAEAIPVNYVGGFMTFYRTGHKIISATKIITEDTDKIEMIFPEDLIIGDFVVVREADHDLIKEMAANFLKVKGNADVIELASKWKEALEIEQLFSTPEEIYSKLVNAGCTKSFQAVKSWLSDDDIIAPQQKQDLQYIAAITESGVLTELLDQVYDAAEEVKAAHVQAGKMLSLQLRSKIVEALDNYGDIDPYNIWNPIEMTVDGIGLVRILKIIDIGPALIVNTVDTNRLIEG